MQLRQCLPMIWLHSVLAHVVSDYLCIPAGYRVYASEGAHSSFAPRGPVQRQLQDWIEKRDGYCEGQLDTIMYVCPACGTTAHAP